MKTRIVRIGNSRGLRIPKALLEEAGLGSEVELRVTSEGLIVAPVAGVRTGWSEAARALSQTDSEDADPFVPTAFDEEEWEW